MCTAISYNSKNHYFGRNLDMEFSYGEAIVITPRNYVLKYRNVSEEKSHYALIGVAIVKDNYPLYYDATNEFGLSMAGLKFDRYTEYKELREDKINLAPFELIPWILGKCKNIRDVKYVLKDVNVADIDFSCELKNTPLHFFIADKENSITLEIVKDGLKIYDNPIGVLTNAPEFPFHMTNLERYKLDNDKGELGIPGDWTSVSRFVKAAFVKEHSTDDGSEMGSVNQFFHILSAVEHQRGCVKTEDGRDEITVYSSCCNTDRQIYYYTTYDNRNIRYVDMREYNILSEKLYCYSMQFIENFLTI